MRKTKIVCTLGPSSQTAEVLEGMIRAGMDVARFNFSHGTHEEHRRRFSLLRRISQRLGRPIAILQDIQGPKIRLGRFEGGRVEVKDGARVTVTTRNILGDETLLPTPIKSLPKDVNPGDHILLDDGRVRLRVLSVDRTEVVCRVEVGGTLKDQKGLNLPGALVSVPTITKKDEQDLKFGQELGFDYVALSFVRSPNDVLRARKLVAQRNTPLIAKIEKPQAVKALAEIAAVSDGIMVARGDLGVEMPLEQLPLVQKSSVAIVNHAGGLVIVATEMLESMVNNARPTRAEVTDVANAVLDGADAVMLSGETAAGKYPVQAVETMSRIITEVEQHGPRALTPRLDIKKEISSGVAAAAVAAANQLGVELIVTYTESGYTARLISEFRPRATILALTPNAETVRRVQLYWGVQGLQVGRLGSTDAMIRQVRRLCVERKVCALGTNVVIVAGVPLNEPGNTNLVGSSRVDLQACKLEYSIVSPK